MAKRRLKNSHKVILFDLAMSKFIDKKLRAAEDKARRNFAKSLVADWKKNLAAAVPFLEMMGVKRSVTVVGLPDMIPVPAVGKEFVRPDGVEVKREDKLVSFAAPLSRSMPANEENMRHFVNRGEDRPFLRENSWRSRHGRDLLKTVDLPETIFLDSASLSLSYSCDTNKGVTVWSFSVNNRQEVTWISQKTLDLLQPFYEAGSARADAENALWRAIGKVIWTSTSYEDVLEYWPEAKQLEDDLFPAKSLGALVPISAEEKAILCNHMSGRGIDAPVCKIAA